MKRRKVAGLQLTTRADLLQFCSQLQLPSLAVRRELATNPSSAAAVAHMGRAYFCIPQAAATFGVEGACFTGPMHMQWVSQLAEHAQQFTSHIDGKYKLHHGVWILLTLGTHEIKVVGEHNVSKLTTTFVPLVYQFCRNHESTGACRMLCQALNIVSQRVCGRNLQPGSTMSDHSDGCRAGLLAEWPRTPHGQCWPHLRRKLGEGAFCSKKRPHFEELPKHLEAVHLSQTTEMRDFFIKEIGKVWDSWGTTWNMRSLWNEYMVAPWDNWSIGLFDCMLCTPSQQAQESY